MASVFHLCSDSQNIKQKIVLKYWDFAESDKKLYFSSVAIQRTWRGYVVRKMIENWNKKATLIQRYIRGWLVRHHMPEYYTKYYYDLSIAHYNTQATKIQAVWRGYLSRKNAVSVKEILAERQEIDFSSQKMQEQMKEFFKTLHNEQWNVERQNLTKILKIMYNRHHLLRTETKEGVFSIHGSNELSCVEKLLKSFPLTDYMKELRKLSEDRKTVSKLKQKRFDLNTNVKPKPYQKMLLSQD